MSGLCDLLYELRKTSVHKLYMICVIYYTGYKRRMGVNYERFAWFIVLAVKEE